MSLVKLIYTHPADIWKYFQSQEINECLIVTPNPAFSDGLRLQIQEQGLSSKIQVDTISNFAKTEIKKSFSNDFNEKYIKNSELFLILSSIWNGQKLGDYYDYQKIFKLLTDLRSFSIDHSLFHEYFEVINEDLVPKVGFLWKFMDQAQLWDEQSLYNKMLEIDYEESRTFCFMGFDFISGNQVDLINHIASHSNVYIPLPDGIQQIENPLDWTDWLKGEERVIETSYEDTSTYYINFEQSTLYESYFGLLNQLDSKDLKFITCCNSSLTLEDEIPFITDNTVFKSPVEIFASELEKIKNEFISKFTQETNLEEFIEHLESCINLSIKSEKIKELKVYSDAKILIGKLSDLFTTFRKIDNFIIKSLFEVLEMNLPRINFITKSTESNCIYRSFKHIGIPVRETDSTLMIIKKEYSDFSFYREFDESLYKLTSIGPVRRFDFEHQLKKINFKNSLKGKKSFILIEKGVIDENPSWNEVLSEIPNLTEKELESSLKRQFTESHKVIKRVKRSSLSASSIQTFIDCPRRFYYNYIEKYNLNIESNLDFNPRDEGILFHKIVETIFKNEKKLQEANLSEISEAILSEYISKNGKILKESDYLSTLLKIKKLSRNVLEKIMPLKALSEIKSFSFESQFNDQVDNVNYHGYIDFIVETEEGVIIFDLKRSSTSIPSAKSFGQFDAVQLWFYASHFLSLPVIGVGYLCGSDVEKSVFFSQSDVCKKLNIKFRRSGRYLGLTTLMKFNFLNYKEFELKVSSEINSKEQVFAPLPKDKNTCDYCAFEPICAKEGSL